jgi:hypothetical protein
MRRNSTRIIATLAVAGLTMLWVQTAQAHPDYGCQSCHVAHNATGDNSEVPLWNPAHTTTTLTGNYAPSDTTDATMSGPNGASKLCLSCHDGTYSHVDSEHSFGDGIRTGYDDDEDGNDDAYGMGSLAGTHPISFIYDTQLSTDDGELVDPTTLASDILDSNSRMQCTSCHDVHNTAAGHTPEDANNNLRWAYGYGTYAAFCRNCHEK